MLDLSDFLKGVKVRTTAEEDLVDLTRGKIYPIQYIDKENGCVEVLDDKGEGNYIYLDFDIFEPIFDEVTVNMQSKKVCKWLNNKGTEVSGDCGDYTSDCDLEWNMSNDESPIENGMIYCPKCGKKIIEIQPPSEVQDD